MLKNATEIINHLFYLFLFDIGIVVIADVIIRLVARRIRKRLSLSSGSAVRVINENSPTACQVQCVEKLWFDNPLFFLFREWVWKLDNALFNRNGKAGAKYQPTRFVLVMPFVTGLCCIPFLYACYESTGEKGMSFFVEKCFFNIQMIALPLVIFVSIFSVFKNLWILRDWSGKILYVGFIAVCSSAAFVPTFWFSVLLVSLFEPGLKTGNKFILDLTILSCFIISLFVVADIIIRLIVKHINRKFCGQFVFTIQSGGSCIPDRCPVRGIERIWLDNPLFFLFRCLVFKLDNALFNRKGISGADYQPTRYMLVLPFWCGFSSFILLFLIPQLIGEVGDEYLDQSLLYIHSLTLPANVLGNLFFARGKLVRFHSWIRKVFYVFFIILISVIAFLLSFWIPFLIVCYFVIIVLADRLIKYIFYK